MRDTDLFGGLDLGQASDFSALAILRREPLPEDAGRDHRGGTLYRYSCVHLHRYELGTSYPSIVSSMVDLFGRPELHPEGHRAPRLAIDSTGAGRPVVDLFVNERHAGRLDAECNPVTITAGFESRWEDGRALVPKAELVSTTQMLLQSGRLRVAERLPLAETLKRELLGFKTKITAAANETFGCWREGVHDDLVLAVAMAAWVAENPGWHYITAY
jgi:hypothetical protein